MTHLDTSFLVDLLRESSRNSVGPATALLDRLGEEALRVNLHVVCEPWPGQNWRRGRPSSEKRVQDLCASLEVVYPDQRFPLVYARTLAALERARSRGVAAALRFLLVGAVSSTVSP